MAATLPSYEQKTKWLSKCKLNLWFVYDLAAETHISNVYFVSSDLYFIAKSKMDVILPIHNKNNDPILNTKRIKACLKILCSHAL